MDSRIFCVRFSLTVAVPFITAETVATEAPASRATSCMVYLGIGKIILRRLEVRNDSLAQTTAQHNRATGLCPDQCDGGAHSVCDLLDRRKAAKYDSVRGSNRFEQEGSMLANRLLVVLLWLALS